MRFAKQKHAGLWAAALALVLAFGVTGCGGSSEGDAGSDESAATQQPMVASNGSPWVNSNEANNLPVEQPEARDDLYLYYNYDYIASHELIGGSTMGDAGGELQTSVTEIIKDESKSSHELDQLRLFYKQLLDTEALAKAGLSEVQPYIDRIEAVSSIEELNELLESEDYPFCPFVAATLGVADMRDVNIVGISPEFVFVDGVMSGGEYYQDSDNPVVQQRNLEQITPEILYATCNLMKVRGLEEDPAIDVVKDALALEKGYGQHADYASQWIAADYGAQAAATKTYSLDELQEICPSVPVKALLAKTGKDESPQYMALSTEWMSELDKVWNNDNLETLKTLTLLSMLKECRPALDPNLYSFVYEKEGMQVPEAEITAYQALDRVDTFGQVLAKTYTDEVLGSEAKERLTKLSEDLRATYLELFQQTTWLNDESKAKALEKMEKMALNILEPGCGFYDYSGLELTPSDQGGTALGNLLALKKYRNECAKAMIGQPANSMMVWDIMSPTTANCFYDPSTNSINILPGFVTSATYRADMTEEELLGGIGAVIGHEMSHGFDFSGSQYDAYATPNSIFTGEDVDAFVARRTKLADYYSTIEISDGVYVDGINTSVEAAADLCGMQVVLAQAKKIDGFDYEKFFATNAKLWCQVVPSGYTLGLALDTHPLNYLRLNVNAQMFDEMYETYGVVEGDNMYLAPESRIVMWGPNA